MDPATMFGPLDSLLTAKLMGVELIKYLLVVLAIGNMGTRFMAYRSDVEAADDEDVEAPSWNPVHAASTILLVLATFYYATFEPHGGVVLTMLVLGMFITDFFEYEVRAVDMRKGQALRRPKGALFASLFVLGYATYQLANEFQAFVDAVSTII